MKPYLLIFVSLFGLTQLLTACGPNTPTADRHAFQTTQDVGQACNQALESMMDQTDEIIYWLRDFHGW